jgi:hypothetical protein
LIPKKLRNHFRILAAKNDPHSKPVGTALASMKKNIPGVGYVNVKPCRA